MKKPAGFCRRWLDENEWASVMSLIIVPIVILVLVFAGIHFFFEGPARKMGFILAGIVLVCCIVRATWGFIMESMLNNHQRVDKYSSSYRID